MLVVVLQTLLKYFLLVVVPQLLSDKSLLCANPPSTYGLVLFVIVLYLLLKFLFSSSGFGPSLFVGLLKSKQKHSRIPGCE